MSSSKIDQSDDEWRREAEKIQSDYSDWFGEWKKFSPGYVEFIKSNVGLILFGVVEEIKEESSVFNYYKCYDADKQEVIENIYKLILKRQKDKLKNKEQSISPLIRVTEKLYKETYYFDTCGRCYSGWDDYKKNNRLPPCIYLAPKYGIYSRASKSNYEVFKSPAAKVGATVEKAMNGVAAVSTIGCLAAGYFALAPVTVTATMISIGVYGVGQSIRTLTDRNSHGQSIALNNKETAFAYGNIVATGLTGASVAAVKNIASIQKVFGTYANVATTACQVLNVSTFLIDSTLFLINAHEFVYKVKEGEVTWKDALDLTLQIFLITGAVIQVRDIHTVLSKSRFSGQGTVNRKLTKTQKRNLQKRRAKARARGEVVSASIDTSSNTVVVGETDAITSMKTFALHAGAFGVNVLMAVMPRSEVIYRYFLDMRDLICDLHSGRIDLKDFCLQFYYHMRNIYSIIMNELTNIQTILRRYIPDRSISNNDNVAQVFTNQVDRINEVTETLAENITGTQDSDELEEDIPQSVTDVEMPNKVVMKLVHDVCLKYSTADTSEGLIKLFHDVLMFTTNKLSKELTERYERSFKVNKKVMGEEKALKMAAALGRKTEDDFYPEKKFFTNIISEVEKLAEEFCANKLVRGSSERQNGTELAQRVFQCLVSSMEDLHSQTGDLNNLGTDQLTRVLQTTCVVLTTSVKDELLKISTTAHQVFKENTKILGEVMAREMMRSIGISCDELEMFQSALNAVSMIEVGQQISRLCIRRYEPPSVSNSSVADTMAVQSIEETLAQITSTLYHRVIENKPALYYNVDKFKVFERVAHFVAEQFIKELTSDGKVQEQLKDNLTLVGPQLFKAMLKTIGVCGGHESALFQEKAQLFTRPDCIKKMVAEFEGYSGHNTVDLENPKIFETTISECGFITHKINCTQGMWSGEYICIAERLFKIKINRNRAEPITSRECVMIKHDKSVITFTFMPEDKTALVVMTDLSRTDE